MLAPRLIGSLAGRSLSTGGFMDICPLISSPSAPRHPKASGPLFSSAAMLAPRYYATREPSADCSCWPAKSWLGDPVHEMAF